MAKTIDTEDSTSKIGPLLMILITVVAIGIGAGGTWYIMQNQNNYETEEIEQAQKKSTIFVDLEIFTVNLQPEENHQYLQVGLTIKTQETNVVEVIKKRMPEIRNRILLLLSSKKATELSSIVGKQQLSKEIMHEIKQTLDSKAMQEEILDVLFTSFVIQ